MKKLISFAVVFAALSYAAPASAALNFGGDASVRVRDTSYDSAHQANDDLNWQYRVRLNGSADLGDGYVFRTQITNEAPGAFGGGGGWQVVGYGNTELYTLGVSQFYFGRFYCDSHYLVGRLPLNATNNPIIDLTLYPKNPLEIPATTFNNDRLYGANYGTKIGPGDLNLVIGVFDNISKNNTGGTGDGLLNDGYAALVSYKTTISGVTIEPEVFTAFTKFDSITQETFSPTSASYQKPWHQGIRPVTFGANVSGVAGRVKLGASGFYNIGKGTTPSSAIYGNNANANVDYTAYLLRVKAEYGPFLAWYDHSATTDNSSSTTQKYTNNFVWAQYQFKVHQSATGSFTIQPTLRYLTTRDDVTPANNTDRLRSELWATVTF